MLLLTILPLVGWADDVPVANPNAVTVGDYTVTLQSWWIAPGENAPDIVSVSAAGDQPFEILQDGGIFFNGKKLAANAKLSEGFTYYHLVIIEDNGVKKGLYVPFYVAQTIPWTRVNAETPYLETVVEPGAYWQYYQEYPASDIWCTPRSASTDAPVTADPEGFILFPGQVPTSDGAAAEPGYSELSNAEWFALVLERYGEEWNFEHTWRAASHSKPDNIVFSLIRFLSDRRAVRRAPSQDPTFNVIARYDGVNKTPWGTRVFGYSGDVKKYGMLSVLPNPNAPAGTKSDIESEFDIEASDFNAQLFSLLLLPIDLELEGEAVDMKSIANATVECTAAPYEYTGVEQKPFFSEQTVDSHTIPADAFVTIPGTTSATTLVEGVDYEIVFTSAGRILPGTYNFRVIGIGDYTGTEVDVDAEATGVQYPSYDIVGAKMIINPAYTEKTYGQEDSEIKPKFAFDATSVVGELGEDYIKQFLTVQRGKDAKDQGEDCDEYNYFIGLTDAYYNGECMYEIVILQNYSLLKINPAELEITVTAATAKKTYGTVDPDFEYTVVTPAQLKWEDANKASGTPGEDDVITSITRATGDDVTADGYAFTATSKNYTVTVTNKFYIEPANTGDFTVTFGDDNWNASTGKYQFVYTGLAQEPTPIVKIGTKLLTPGTDYIVDTESADKPKYNNNKDVSTLTANATCTVTLTGNYTGTVTGNFWITPATLTITANSYNAEPATYGWTYSGWVNESEGTATESRLPETDFTAPTGVTKSDQPVETNVWKLNVTEDAEAKNYTIEYVPGLLALNNKPVIEVYPAAFAKTYDGMVADPEDVTIEAYKNGNRFNGTKLTDQELQAIMFIPGDPIFEITIPNAGKDRGRYNIQLTGATVLENYTVHYNNLNNGYTINRKDVTLTVDDATKVYGGPVPTLTATVEGLIEGETAATAGITDGTAYNVTLEPEYTRRNGQWIKRTGRYEGRTYQPEHVTTTDPDTRYPISISLSNNNGNVGNYHIASYTAGMLSVTPAAVTITADDKTKAYGTSDPQFTVTITGADGNPVSTATRNELNGYYEVSRPDAEETTGEDVGKHDIVVSAPVVEGEGTEVTEITPENYTITFKNGKLTITEAEIRIAANSQFIPFGGDINHYDVQITLPGNERLIWQTVNGTTPLTDAQKEINDKIEGIVKLSVLPGKDKLGGNKDAYGYTLQSSNYVLAENGFTNGWLTVGSLKVIPLAKSELAKLTNKPLHQVLEAHKGQTVKVILTKREMTPNEWYEWVLPFDVKPRDLFSTPYFVTDEVVESRWGYGAIDILDVDKSKNGQVVFDITVNTIPANTPFLVKIDKNLSSADCGTIEFDNVVIDPNATYADEEGNAVNPVASATDESVNFVGLYDDKDGLADNEMALMIAGTKPHREFYRGKTGQPNMDAFRLIRTKAFLEFPTAADAVKAQIIIEEADGSYTAINGVEANGTISTEGIYNLSGQRVNKAQKGIYIKDGKKVLVK